MFDGFRRRFRNNNSSSKVSVSDFIGEIGVEAFVDQLPESDRERIRENLWGRLEFDTPYAVSNQERFVGAPGKFTLLREVTRLI